SFSLVVKKYPLPPAAPYLFAITNVLISFGLGMVLGMLSFDSIINFSFIFLSDSHLRIHLLPKIGILIDSICDESIWEIRVPCGISTASSSFSFELHFCY